MKIAYILDLFPVFSETFIVREILELRRKGFNVLVFARKSTAGLSYSEVVHAEAETLKKYVHYFPSLRNKMIMVKLAAYHVYFLFLNPVRYLKTFWFACRRSKRVFRIFLGSLLCAMKFKRTEIAHIHAHFVLDACTYAMLISMLIDIPYSFTAHAHDIFIPGRAELLEDKFNRAKFAVCISEFNKKYVLKEYPAIDPDNIRIIHCGIDLRSITFGTKKKDEKSIILAVGRLVEQKGFKYLIHGCKLLREERTLAFVCKIIGEGGDRPELEEIIRKHDLSEVVSLLGPMEQGAVVNVLKSAVLFVLPCVVERTGSRDGIPVALMEAMAMGIPVISTRVSGIPELVKNGAGILVEPKDVDGLAIAMKKILMLRDEKREEMGKRGRAVVEENFNLAREVRKLAELFKS